MVEESIHQVSEVMGRAIQTDGRRGSSHAAIEQLRTLGADYAQGNWISPPRPLTDVCTPRPRPGRG